jgi:hypothetical protein
MFFKDMSPDRIVTPTLEVHMTANVGITADGKLKSKKIRWPLIM